MALFGLFGKTKKEPEVSEVEKQDLDHGLERSRTGLFGKIAHAIAGKTSVDDSVLDELEEILVSSDVGVDTTLKIISCLQERVKRAGVLSAQWGCSLRSSGAPGLP